MIIKPEEMLLKLSKYCSQCKGCRPNCWAKPIRDIAQNAISRKELLAKIDQIIEVLREKQT